VERVVIYSGKATKNMKITSVNIGKIKTVRVGGQQIRTAIGKRPVQGAVAVNSLGLEGDNVCNPRHHGGVDQAVYAYRVEDYAFWSAKLGRPIPSGTFGENLTISGMPEYGLMIGDRLEFDGLLLEATAPRIPCNVLAAQMEDKQFPKLFTAAGRAGVYFRVLEVGKIEAGMQGQYQLKAENSLSTQALFLDQVGPQNNLSKEKLLAYLSLPIDKRTRTKFQTRLK